MNLIHLGLYNAFLAPGSPCELNIDHNLRNSLADRMTRAVGDDDSMLNSLHSIVALFKEAQISVFKLMSSVSNPISGSYVCCNTCHCHCRCCYNCLVTPCSEALADHLQDSVPKFLRETRYAHVLREHNFDQVYVPPTGPTSTLPERTPSRKESENRGS